MYFYIVPGFCIVELPVERVRVSQLGGRDLAREPGAAGSVPGHPVGV